MTKEFSFSDEQLSDTNILDDRSRKLKYTQIEKNH